MPRSSAPRRRSTESPTHPEGPPANPILTVAGTPPRDTPVPAFVPGCSPRRAIPVCSLRPLAAAGRPRFRSGWVALRGSGDSPANPGWCRSSTVLPARPLHSAAGRRACLDRSEGHIRPMAKSRACRARNCRTNVSGLARKPQAAKPRPCTAAHVMHQGTLASIEHQAGARRHPPGACAVRSRLPTQAQRALSPFCVPGSVLRLWPGLHRFRRDHLAPRDIA